MITDAPFGALADGSAATQYTLVNETGARIGLTDYGATLTQAWFPDRDGQLADVVLGFDSADRYESGDNSHFGCTTGRVANRIAGGRFTVDGVEYQIACKYAGPNAIHGGVENTIDRKLWTAEPRDGADGPAVEFRYTSPDGEENFPGELDLGVTFTLTHAGAIRIDYRVKTDRATPVNLTNHSYFNLLGAGEPSVADHVLTLNADAYTPGDKTQVPTGDIASVEGTPLDFRTATPIGAREPELRDTPERGYDHNFVINASTDPLPLAADLYEPTSGRVMTVRTTQPGVQLYGAAGLRNQVGKQGKTYPPRSACCLETQHFPNAINQPNFPSILLCPGEVYQHTCEYAFSVR